MKANCICIEKTELYIYIYIYTGGHKFGKLTFISLSLKNKEVTKSKNLCLVKFEVLSYQNTKKWLNTMSMSDPQINLNSWGGTARRPALLPFACVKKS